MMQQYLWAGGPSMMMLIHRICMAFSGLGKFISVAREMSVSAAMLLNASRESQRSKVKLKELFRNQPKVRAYTHVLSWKRTKFLMLL